MGEIKAAAGNEFSPHPQLSLEVGGRNGPRLKRELPSGGIYTSSWANHLLDRLKNSGRQEMLSVVKFSLQEVGIRNYVSGPRGWEEVVNAVKKKGLALCPQLTAPEIARLNADIIEEGQYVDILSEPITDRDGDQSVFELSRGGGRLGLFGRLTDRAWPPGHLVVARLR